MATRLGQALSDILRGESSHLRIKTSTVALAPATPALLVSANLDRIYVAFTWNANAVMVAPAFALLPGLGYGSSQTPGYHEFYWSKHGPLVQSDWYGSSNGGNVLVVEVIVSK